MKKFAHEEAYRGDDLVARLAKTQIVICGAGALGSNLAETLVRQGCTSLRVIDMDRVDTHNVNTQVYGDADHGALKVNALKNILFRAVGVEIDTQGKRMTKSNVKKFLKGAGLVLDTFDNSESRRLVHDYCVANKIPCLHAGMHADYGEAVWSEAYTVPQDVTEGDVCDYPLARNLVTFVVTVAAEEVLDFCLSDSPRRGNWAITLKDLQVRPYR